MTFNDTQSRKIVNQIVDELAMNPVTDKIPLTIVPTIQPVFPVTQRITNAELLDSSEYVVNFGSTDSTGATVTLKTTPNVEGQDFFLSSIRITFVKDATCNVASTASLGPRIRATIGGTAVVLANFPQITLTGQELTSFINYSLPIKIDKNTAIELVNSTFTAGTLNVSATITGYNRKRRE